MPFELQIVTPQGAAYSGEVEIRSGSEVIYAAIADGFAEVNGTEVVVLVESCETASDLDLARAELAHSRAEAGLAALGEDAHAKRIEEYEDALARARTRMAVAKRS